MKHAASVRFNQVGISYVEILIAMIIIALTAIPASNALRGAMVAVNVDAVESANHFRLLARMEEVLAEPFDTVSAQAMGSTTPTSYSDSGGTPNRRLVYVSAYDGDNADTDNNPFTGVDAGLLWVRVEVEGSVAAFQALKAE